jgi:hypothetical protein
MYVFRLIIGIYGGDMEPGRSRKKEGKSNKKEEHEVKF